MDPSTEYKKHMDKTKVIGVREGDGAIHNPVPKGPKGAEMIMKEFYHGTLHSGKGGPVVTNPRQAKAIAMSASGQSRKK